MSVRYWESLRKGRGKRCVSRRYTLFFLDLFRALNFLFGLQEDTMLHISTFGFRLIWKLSCYFRLIWKLSYYLRVLQCRHFKTENEEIGNHTLKMCVKEILWKSSVLLRPVQTLISSSPFKGVNGDIRMLLLKCDHVFYKRLFKKQTKALLFFLLLVFLLFDFFCSLCFICRALIQSMLERCDRFLWSQQA